MSTAQDVLLAELELHKSEFESLRTEVLHWLDGERQFLNMTLVAVAAALGVAPLILEQRAYLTLLLFPAVFHVLLWEMLNAVKSVNEISAYFADKLIPRVNTILDLLGAPDRGMLALGWEVQTRAGAVSASLWSAITPTRYWLPILAIAALLIFYLVVTGQAGYTPSIIEFVLILVNLLFLVLAAVRNVQVVSSVIKDAERLQQQFAPPKQEQSTTRLQPVSARRDKGQR
ncbi:MAG: hypothetical protein HXY40_11180 [Chloroflexi bacterium]|nr:hypothetical protein [Chloroflexota bacterium]